MIAQLRESFHLLFALVEPTSLAEIWCAAPVQMGTSVTRGRHWLRALFGITLIARQLAIVSLAQMAMTARLVLRWPVLLGLIHLPKILLVTFVLPDISVQLCPANRQHV